MFFNKLQCYLYSKLRYIDDTFLFGNSCCLERTARYITYIVVDRTRGVNCCLLFLFVWVGAHQHRQAHRGLSKNLLKYGGYAFFVSSVSYSKIIEISSLFNIFFSYRVYHGFVVKIIEMLWGFKKEHTYFSFGWTWFSIFIHTAHCYTLGNFYQFSVPKP